jgi:MFS family permease
MKNFNVNDQNAGLRLIFRSLRYRNFRLFFAGQGLSLIGTWIQLTAMPWLVYQISGSVVLLGVIGFAGQIPTLLISPFAGVMTDRWNRRRILMTTQTLSMIQALFLALLYFTGVIEIWHIAVLSVILGCINAFDTPARQSFFIEMINKKEDLGNAIALNSSMVNAARLVGPSIAGMMIAYTNEGVCFLINGISYLFVIGSLLAMKLNKQTVNAKKTNVSQDLKEGFNYVAGFAPAKYIILGIGLSSLMGMQFGVLLPVFAKDVLSGGSHTFGFLMGASGVGALIAALYLASKKNVIGLFKRIPLAAGIFGTGLVCFSFSRNLSISLVLIMVTGFGMMLQTASSNTILQTIAEDDKRGRVMSFYTMAFMGAAPFGSLLAGGLAGLISAPYTMLAGGTCILVGSLVFWYKLPGLRKMIKKVYIELGIVHPDLH